MQIRNEIKFILNNRDITLDAFEAEQTLLDFLRLDQQLIGTKEGCAEGDCGACTVLVGRLVNGGLKYEIVNACIRFLASLDGCHVVTIEYLSGSNGDLHPVQKAMVECHASQCGFCTPGFVMSLYSLWMENPNPSKREVEIAVQGNLCRCTGYEPIINAALAVNKFGNPISDQLITERENTIKNLSKLQDNARVVIRDSTIKSILPANIDDLADVLIDQPSATIVAGATDVGLWVTKFLKPISPALFIGHLTDLKKIEVKDDVLIFGAGVTYTEIQEYLSKFFPFLDSYWDRIAGWQVRNMGTIGGNIANGSPIGDTPPVLIALNSGLPGMGTLHANSPRDAIVKLQTLPLLAGENISHKFIAPTVALAIDLIVHAALDSSGVRRVKEVAAVTGRYENDRAEIEMLWKWDGHQYIRGVGSLPHPEKFETIGSPLSSWWHA